MIVSCTEYNQNTPFPPPGVQWLSFVNRFVLKCFPFLGFYMDWALYSLLFGLSHGSVVKTVL